MFKHIPIGEDQPKEVNAIIEIPAGTHNKYEYDEKLDVIKLDRVLFPAMYYPVDYGFIPETRSEDGDHLDILVITNHPTFPGCLVTARVIGVLQMLDKGERDDKIIAVPADNVSYKHVNELEHMDAHLKAQIENFFATYKILENKKIEIVGWAGKKEAYETIKQGIEREKKK